MEERLSVARLSAFCKQWLREHEFSRFLLSGTVNTVTTYLIYVGLVLFLPYPVAYTVTTALGILLSYYLNARFVFRQPLRLSAALRYPAVYGIQYVLGLFLLYLLVELGHFSKFVAPIFIVFATVPVTFVLSRLIISRKAVPPHISPRLEAARTRLVRLRKVADSWLISWPGQLCLAAAIAMIYLIAYRNHPAVPGPTLGWWTWWDQGQYWRCAADLAQGKLTSDTYWYPLGYPALGALFYRWMPQHAFLVPDLLLIVGATLLLFRIARKFVFPTEALLLLAIFIVCYRGLLSETLIIPWNTIPTHFLSYSIILLAGLGPVVKKRLLLAAFCVGLMYLCRPGDAFCLALVLGLGILRLPSWTDRIRIGAGSFLIVIAFCAIVLSINRAVFHQWTTPYDKVVADCGFGSYPFGIKLFSLVVDARPLFWDTEVTLISHLPWLLLIIPGITYLLYRRFFETFGILLGIGATHVIYFQFNDFWPGNLFRYRLVHYLAWTLPILALFAYLGIREAWRIRAGRWSYGLMIAVGATAALLTLKLDVAGKISAPVPLIGEIDASPAQPVDWIIFENPETSPRFSSDNHELPVFTGFVQPKPTKGLLTLLSKEARKKTIGYDASASGPIKEVRFGRFAWRLKPIGRMLRRWTAAPARVITIGKESGVDVAGPAGVPDGQPDEVIELDLARDTLREIKVWTVQADDGSAGWKSEPGPEHWWLIKVLPGERQPSRGRGTVRLCLPEVGQLDGARPATVRGLDESGGLLLQLAISTARKP